MPALPFRILPLLLVSLGTGCSTGHQILLDDQGEVSGPRSDRFHLDVETRSAEIRMRRGGTAPGAELVLAGSALHWTEPAFGERQSTPLADIAHVSLRDPGRGASEGALVGLALGAGLGLIVGLAASSDCLSDSQGNPIAAEVCDPGGLGFLGAALFGVGGAGVGALIGAAEGHRDVYTFVEPPGLRHARSAPPAGAREPPEGASAD